MIIFEVSDGTTTVQFASEEAMLAFVADYEYGTWQTRSFEKEVPAPTKEPDWQGLEQSLWQSSLMSRALQEANPNGFSLLLKVFTDGKDGLAVESSLAFALGVLGLVFSEAEKGILNALFEQFDFTIRV